jgi:demethylmenaquinone methyltransferase / 2-methoxy-6-polyprenyl-1,4-benzoquinol methylase
MNTDRSTPPAGASDPLRPHPPLTRYYQNEEQRWRRVGSWFDKAAGDYDWLNQAASFGSGSRYRRQALLRSGLAEGMSLLDAGSGTGVIAAIGQQIVGRRGLVVSLDPSLGMMSHAARRGVKHRVRGIAEALPFPSEHFDRLTMGYALRHVADLHATFQEYRRVLKPGGKVLLLEITRPSSRLQHGFLRFYLGRVVPFLARFGRGGRTSKELMEYYWDTIESCVPPEVILGALREAGFSNVERRVQNGMLSEYTGVR